MATADAAFVLHGISVLDEAGGFSKPVDVRVHDGKVASIGLNTASKEDRSVDASGLFLLPGVFDCHTHLGMSSLDPFERMSAPPSRLVLEAAAAAKRTLDAGVTFVRDPGGSDAGLRDAIATGLIPGPRMQVAITMLSQTGGHADGYLPGPGLSVSASYMAPYASDSAPYVVDGPLEMQKAVRQLLRAGADWIKICTSGGFSSPHDDPMGTEFTFEEVRAAVLEAGRRGKSVMSHVMTSEGIDIALDAGVRSLEHAIFLTDEQAERAARDGVTVVPTLTPVSALVATLAEGRPVPPGKEVAAVEIAGAYGQCVSICLEHGVRIALGSDTVRASGHGRNLGELALLAAAGMSPEQALLAATINGAELCGVADRLGKIAPGYLFDAIIVDSDPGDLSAFADPTFVQGVFKGGEPVRPHPRLA
jgi:imidazolonepropionase-like amidohydrolase